MASIFHLAKRKFLEGGINLSSDTIKMALLNNSYSVNLGIQQYFGDISSLEVSGTGYVPGGKALTNKQVTNLLTGEGKFDCDDVTWNASGGSLSGRHVVLYKDTGNPATSVLLYHHDLGSMQTATNANFVIQINANGVLQLS